MHLTLQSGWILHHRPYRETSVLLDVFTEQQGRIGLIARGVRKKNSPTAALLQPLTALLLSWSGKTELKTLTGVEALKSRLMLQGHAYWSAFYINELLFRLLPKEDAYPELYAIYQNTLFQLQQQTFHESILRRFEKSLLAELGYGLPLHSDCQTGESIVPDKWYQFIPTQGFTATSFISSLAPTLFQGRSLIALDHEDWPDHASLQDAKRLMRLALQPHLGDHPLNSRALFKSFACVSNQPEFGA